MSVGKLNAQFVRRVVDDDGNMELTFRVDGSSRWAAGGVVDDLRRLSADGKPEIVITIDPYRSKRSLAQNRLMWALLEVMARAMNGGRTGGVTAWDCYLDMLERYGGKFEYIQCLKAALPKLREMFRAIKIVEERDHNTVFCKAFVGSSQFNAAEMTQMIDGLFDELAGMEHVDDAELSYLHGEWLQR